MGNLMELAIVTSKFDWSGATTYASRLVFYAGIKIRPMTKY